MVFQLDLKIKTTCQNNIFEENNFRYFFSVDKIRLSGEDRIAYDPKLKIHFKSNTSLSYVYQLDIIKIQLDLCPRLEKASDLIRRASYINDWAEINIKPTGQVISVENSENELKETIAQNAKIEVGQKLSQLVGKADIIASSGDILIKSAGKALVQGAVDARVSKG